MLLRKKPVNNNNGACMFNQVCTLIIFLYSCMLTWNSSLFGTLECFYAKLTAAQNAAKFVHPK